MSEPLHQRLRKLAVMVEHGTEVVEDVRDVLTRTRAMLGLKLASRAKKAKADLDAAKKE